MTYNTEEQYFRWLCDMVLDQDCVDQPSYSKLMRELHYILFEPIINEMDEPRAIDGENLRYRFGQEYGIDIDSVENNLFQYPCTVLEMLVALALRCEEQIMDNPDIGDRTSLWFWIMIVNLGLGEFSDDAFDRSIVDEVLETFIFRRYNRDGTGGNVFILKNRTQDLRKIDIWYQMCWFISDFIRDEETDNGL